MNRTQKKTLVLLLGILVGLGIPAGGGLRRQAVQRPAGS